MEPGAKVSGSRAAAPAPPPVQPNIGPSHSIPSDGQPPTDVFLMVISSPLSETVAPTVATTSNTPSLTLGALVTTLMGSSAPMSTLTCFNLSLPAMASQD